MLKIKKKDWENYINALAGVSERAAKDMQDFVDKNGMEDVTTIIAKSYQCSVKYGEAAMALTCEMYDKIAVVQGAKVPPAVPARSVTMQEVKDTVNHALRTAPSTVPAVAGKLVKKSSSRTMRKNAARDGARMALVPSGDGCPFCKMLGSRGWEPARSKRSKTFEAHLHAHCRCEYVVDFTGDMQVEGYDPDALYDEFMSLDGTSWEERMNIMRNQQRQNPAIRDKINAQKRAAYARHVAEKKVLDGGVGERYNDSPARGDDTRELLEQLTFVFSGFQEFIPIHTIIEEPLVIAGKGSRKELRIADRLVNKYAEYESDPLEWKKMVGKVYSDKYLFDIHWYECEDRIVRDPKIKYMKEKK